MPSETTSPYGELARQVCAEVEAVLRAVDPREVEALADAILAAGRVYFLGIGRVFLALQCFAKRVAHFGIEVFVVGAIAEKPIGPGDLLIVASGSGETVVPVAVARVAKGAGARLAHLTVARESTLRSLADLVVELPAGDGPGSAVVSMQPMSTLFDQSLHVFGDVVCLLLQRRTGQSNADLRARHANLE